LLKENSNQKSEELEEEINQLKKEYNQKKQKLEELEKQLNYIIEKKQS
jgi:predicted RNase H-like nuclease (RuvC/YqgF family)